MSLTEELIVQHGIYRIWSSFLLHNRPILRYYGITGILDKRSGIVHLGTMFTLIGNGKEYPMDPNELDIYGPGGHWFILSLSIYILCFYCHFSILEI